VRLAVDELVDDDIVLETDRRWWRIGSRWSHQSGEHHSVALGRGQADRLAAAGRVD